MYNVLYCVLHWCPVRTGLLKLTWLPLDHSWNRVSGLIAADVCPKGLEPWEKSAVAWPGNNNTPLYWDPEERLTGGSPGFGEFCWMISTPTPASQHAGSHTNKVSIFHWGATLVFLWSAAEGLSKQILTIVIVCKVLWVCGFKVWPVRHLTWCEWSLWTFMFFHRECYKPREKHLHIEKKRHFYGDFLAIVPIS